MIIYRGLRERSDRVAVPLVSYTGGVVARPNAISVACSYGVDGATQNLNGGPQPGCPRIWCNPEHVMEQNGYCGFNGAPPHAWRPEHLKEMLKLHQTDGGRYSAPGYHSGYNEVVVGARSWNSHLPSTVEAFFVLAGHSDRDAELAHERFLSLYGLSAGDVPLLRFHPSRWDAPFESVT